MSELVPAPTNRIPNSRTEGILQEKATPRKTFLFWIFLVFVGVLALAALLSPNFLTANVPQLQSGQVSDQDILADRDLSYTSDVLTNRRRQEARVEAPKVYTLPDIGIARKQMDRLRNTLAYINSVRSDSLASTTQKLEDLAALDDIVLKKGTAEKIIALNEARWQAVEQESINVLEQVMRRAIQPEQIDQVMNSVPTMVSLALSPTQAEIVSELVQGFIAPNSFYSDELTLAAQQEAVNQVVPVTRSFVSGQTIVRRGQVLDAADLEALEKFGVISPTQNWQDIVAAVALVALMGSLFILYLRISPNQAAHPRSLVVISVLFLLFLVGARLTVYGHVVLPYLYPVATYTFLITALFGLRLAMISSLPLAVMITYGMPNSLELTLLYILSSLIGAMMLGKARRISSFLWAGLAVTLSGWLVILSYRLISPETDWVGMLTLFAALALNGITSAIIAVLLQYPLANFMGTTTPMQLMELTRPDHPLLQMLLHQAPGTYQHSLQVANLAENAAEAIGADTLLTRVGALYHDCGKASNPIFFIENQPPAFTNPHDELEPEVSAELIIRHVADGIKLAKAFRLPRRIHQFIREHHGTTMTRYQYAMAIGAAGGDESKVDPSCFRYPGPRPQSRETAILMLADACEARLRAERTNDDEVLHSLIKKTINHRLEEGELDDTELTLRELDAIADSFTTTLRGFYHPRVQYPQIEVSRGMEGSPRVEKTLVPASVGQGRRSDDATRPVVSQENPKSS
jgi:hypothetical protein